VRDVQIGRSRSGGWRAHLVFAEPEACNRLTLERTHEARAAAALSARALMCSPLQINGKTVRCHQNNNADRSKKGPPTHRPRV
jgi:hypothetical protein